MYWKISLPSSYTLFIHDRLNQLLLSIFVLGLGVTLIPYILLIYNLRAEIHHNLHSLRLHLTFLVSPSLLNTHILDGNQTPTTKPEAIKVALRFSPSLPRPIPTEPETLQSPSVAIEPMEPSPVSDEQESTKIIIDPPENTASHTKFQKVRQIRAAHCKSLITLIYDKGFEKWYQTAVAPSQALTQEQDFLSTTTTTAIPPNPSHSETLTPITSDEMTEYRQFLTQGKYHHSPSQTRITVQTLPSPPVPSSPPIPPVSPSSQLSP